MQVSTSFLSSKNIPSDLKKLNMTDTDFIHVDIMDGKFVKNKTMPFKEMKHIHDFTSKRLDVHLMVENVEKYIPLYAELNTEYITFHVETDNVEENIERIKNYSIKCGLAISPMTKVKELLPYLPFIDLVLVMSVEPGSGGQEFILETKEKVEELITLRKNYNFNFKISVDGGINDKTKDFCKEVDIIVAGSYVLSGNSFQDKISSLRT